MNLSAMSDARGSEWPESLRSALAEKGRIPFDEFCRIALYDPADGYYMRKQTRVGATREADFQTNLSVRSVFAPLVVEAVEALLKGRDLADYSFVEIGAEPETSLLQGESHPFGSVQVIRVGEPIPALRRPTILFANEWLDAQPFVRLIFQDGRWNEAFVEAGSNGNLREVMGDPASEGADLILPELPQIAPEGYRLDLSVEAESLLEGYLSGDWPGAFLTFDYGTSWEALLQSLPGGTARAYYRHQQVGDLLVRPGGQDLTCNVCWDRLAGVLKRSGFSVSGPSRQEAFFLQHSSQAIRRIVEGGESPEACARRARAMQLLNPVHFGAAFQALWGIR